MLYNPFPRAIRSASLLATLSLGVSRHSLIAEPHPAFPFRSVLDSLTDSVQLAQQLASITTDTGALAPGHRDWSRYPNLLSCAAASIDELQRFRGRDIPAQELRDTLSAREIDSVPPAIRTMFASCRAHVSMLGGTPETLVDTVVPQTNGESSLVLPFQIALKIEDDSLTHILMFRLLASPNAVAKGVTSRADKADWLVQSLLNESGNPPRPYLARLLVNHFDSLEPAALHGRLRLYSDLMEFEGKEGKDQQAAQDAEAIIAIGHDMRGEQLRSYAQYVEGAYIVLMRQAFSAGHTDSLIAIARRAQQDLDRVDGPVGNEHRDFIPIKNLPLQQVVEDLLAGTQNKDVRSESIFPRVQADFWFPTAPGDTIQPASGKVSLIVGLDPACNLEGDPINGGCGPGFAPEANALRRWIAKYGSAHLAVTVVVRAPWETFMDGLVTPAQAAERIRWYVQEYEQLPVTVAVQIVRHQDSVSDHGVMIPLNFPLADGRYFLVDNSYSEAMEPRVRSVVVGQDGRPIGNLEGGGAEWYHSVQRVLEDAVRQSSSSSTLPSAKGSQQ